VAEVLLRASASRDDRVFTRTIRALAAAVAAFERPPFDASLRHQLRLDQRLCILVVLASAVDAPGLLQVGRPGQPRKMLSTSMLDRKALGSEMAWREEQ
jgi:hypothetical protein